MSRQLPFTGFPLLIVLGISAAMLLAGLVLRRVTCTMAAVAYSGSDLTPPRAGGEPRSTASRPSGEPRSRSTQRMLRLDDSVVWMLLFVACVWVLLPRGRRR